MPGDRAARGIRAVRPPSRDSEPSAHTAPPSPSRATTPSLGNGCVDIVCASTPSAPICSPHQTTCFNARPSLTPGPAPSMNAVQRSPTASGSAHAAWRVGLLGVTGTVAYLDLPEDGPDSNVSVSARRGSPFWRFLWRCCLQRAAGGASALSWWTQGPPVHLLRRESQHIPKPRLPRSCVMITMAAWTRAPSNARAGAGPPRFAPPKAERAQKWGFPLANIFRGRRWSWRNVSAIRAAGLSDPRKPETRG